MSTVFNSWYSCLFPLLDSLGWKGDRNALKDYFFGYNSFSGIQDFRNILAALGYHSRSLKISLDQIDPRLLPCFFVTPKGEPYCLMETSKDGWFVFSGKDQAFKTIENLEGNGRIVVFSPLEEERESLVASRKDWLGIMFRRFKKNALLALGFSLLLGLLSLMYPILIRAIYGQMTIQGNETAVLGIGIGVAVFLLSELSFRYLRSYLLGYTSLRTGKILGEELFRRLFAFQSSFTENASKEAQIRRIKDLRNLADFISGRALSALLDLPFVLFMILWMVSVGGSIALVPSLSLLLFGLITLLVYYPIKHVQSEAAQCGALRMDSAAALVRGIEDITTSGMRKSWQEKFNKASAHSSLMSYKAVSASFWLNAFSQFYVSAGGLLTLYVGVRMVLAGQIPTAALIASMMLVWRVLGTARSTFTILNQVDSLGKSLDQLRRFMSLPQETRPSPFSVSQAPVEGGLSFRDISFRYGTEGYPALYGVSFSAEPEKLTILSGHEGAGKTTLLKLALALYKPQAGRILIGPFNIFQIDPSHLRRSISYVEENPKMLHTSFKKFIRGSDRVAEDQFRAVVKRVGLHEYLEMAGVTMDMTLDDLGADLKNDAERLACICRAILKESSLYLFDEQVFTQNAKFFPLYMKEIANLASGGAAVLAVSNDPAVSFYSNNIVRLNAGRIIKE